MREEREEREERERGEEDFCCCNRPHPCCKGQQAPQAQNWACP